MIVKSQKIVVITGAGRGIGRSIALEFSNRVAIVVVAEINETNGLSVCSEIEALMKTVEKEFGCIDVLINNAGLSEFSDPLVIDELNWDRILDTNLKGLFFASREAVKLMMKNGGGSIVNIASTRALMSEPNSEAYAASKGGILALTHAMAASFSQYNVTVNAILPGWIETGDYSVLR